MRTSQDSPEELEELRRLLLRKEREELARLRERLADQQLRAREVANVLPQSVKISQAHGDELGRALQPAVEGSVRQSISANPKIFVDALHPILGPMVRRSIAESFRRLLQSLNQTLAHTFSWQGLKWRLEAARTGKSFAEVVMLRSLVYRVEQLFLIHRETSVALLHVAADSATTQDSDMVASMLSAIQDFARDSFKTGEDSALEEFRIGELQVWIAPGRHAYLAAVIRGNPPRELRTALEETIESADVMEGGALANFSGDTAPFEALRPELEACLRAQYAKEKDGNVSRTRAVFAITIFAAAILLVSFLRLQSQLRWRDFLRRLDAEPGIAVTSAEKHWFDKSRITGLRDPLATDTATLAKAANLDPKHIRSKWKDYFALDPVIVRRRFAERFSMPKNVKFSIAKGAVQISGQAPYEWLERVRREGTQIPGVASITEQDLKTTYDPGLTLDRFKSAFPLPATVKAVIANETLSLVGSAPYEWIAPVRESATKIPGITAINGDALVVEFDPKLVLQRFQDRFGLPDTVKADVEAGRLTLTGQAPHAWLDRVRRGATEIAGIRALDDLKIDDTDQRAFQQSKSVIESAYVYFLSNKDNFATEGFAALSRLPDEIRRCFDAAQRMGVNASLEIRGYADAVGAESANTDLSRRRADAVRNFLIACGLDGGMMKSLGLGAPPPPAPGEKPAPEESDRRVALRIVIQP
ncbi:MAG: OmpA family protein [Verrucomicrobiota bacterium]|nr:OmpA family protein [Verrucomicrobiota bacterium]